jgi:Domain of unknown function (DUF4261)
MRWPWQKKKEVSISLAMVALKSAEGFDARSLAEKWKQLWPAQPPMTGVQQEANASIAMVGEPQLTIGIMPAPLPAPDLERACARSWAWPDARETLAGHKAHAIVSVTSHRHSVPEVTWLLTRAIVAMLECVDAAGIYWGSAEMVLDPEVFAKEVKESDADESLPLLLWINILVSSDDGRATASTRGLSALGHKEFEVIDSSLPPEKVLDFVGSVIAYLLGSGAVLKHGQTIGLSAEQKISIEHRESAFNKGTQVIRLGL